MGDSLSHLDNLLGVVHSLPLVRYGNKKETVPRDF